MRRGTLALGSSANHSPAPCRRPRRPPPPPLPRPSRPRCRRNRPRSTTPIMERLWGAAPLVLLLLLRVVSVAERAMAVSLSLSLWHYRQSALFYRWQR